MQLTVTVDNLWREKWAEKEISPELAIEKIRPGSRIYISTGCAEPQTLVDALLNAPSKFMDIEIVHYLSLRAEKCHCVNNKSTVRHNTFSTCEFIREKVQKGEADYTPILTSQISGLFSSGKKNIDVALVQLSPPDEFGFCSLGIDLSFSKDVIKAVPLVIAEINPNMPRTCGDGFIHIKDVKYYIYTERPLLEYKNPEPDEIDMRIAENIVTLIRHKSCLHLGLGTIPSAVLRYLATKTVKNDLGIHSFIITDDIIPLIEKGLLTCRKKNYHPEKITTSLALGSNKLFQILHNNPYFEFHKGSQVSNPMNIARNDRMVSINQVLQIDLTGQVSATYREYQFYTGLGDSLDFIRGSAFSKGGKPIIALRSTDASGTKSRIVPHFEEGANISVSQADIHYVVTEWGIAFLYGKSIRERALELINIAHPLFRQQLLEEIKEKNFIYPDQVLHINENGEIAIFPRQYETLLTLKSDEKVTIRPLKVTDEKRLQDLIYSTSAADRYMRYFSPVENFNHEKIQKDVAIDYHKDMSLGAFIGEIGSEEMIGNAVYYLEPQRNMAEVAFIVKSDWQAKGVASALLSQLTIIARERNLHGLYGSVLYRNTPAINLIRKVYQNYHLEMDIPNSPDEDEEVYFTVKFI